MSFFNNNTTTTEFPVTESPTIKPDEFKFLIAPLVVILVVMILSILVYLMARKRRMIILRHTLLSLYEFDSNEKEWESLNQYDNPLYTGEVRSTNF